jgi:hypothetical protein
MRALPGLARLTKIEQTYGPSAFFRHLKQTAP